jgi:glutamine synthetase
MGKFVNTTEDFFSYCKDNEVEFVDFRFTDIKGAWHHISYRISAVTQSQLDNGLPFDGSSIEAWQPIDKSDMLLKPSIETAFLDPFTADSTIIIICSVYDIYKNEMYAKCPRSIAIKSLEYLAEANIGDTAYFGPENEYFIFEDVRIKDGPHESHYKVDTEDGGWNRNTPYEGGNMGHISGNKGGYFPVPPIDKGVDLRAETMLLLEQIGLEVILGHHEVAQGQHEIGIVYKTLVEAADNVQKLKYIVKMVAHLNGKTATFMPKPIHGDNGNGMHVHQSIWKDGVNTFYTEGNYGNLSDNARYYAGGIFKHAYAVAAFTNASTNSYKRLVPGFEAPSILTYSAQNRSAACRVPYGAGAAATRLEMRFPDSTANPYLAFSAMMMAGIDGIKNKTEPVGPMDIDLFELSLDEIRERDIPQMPNTLRMAVEGLIADNDFLQPVFTKDFIDTYQHYQYTRQIWPYEARPTPFEVLSTYSC